MQAGLFRLDIGSIGKVERTPQGGLRIPAFLTRTGVFEYVDDAGQTIREYRPPEEVFNSDSMASLKDAPVTNTHPPEHIDPKNFKKHSVGHVSGEAARGEDKLGASLIVQDARAMRDIDDGRREISCGYHCDVDETPGVTPLGEKYDRVQRNIRYNHVAIVDSGRAGPTVRLRLDAKGNAILDGQSTERKNMDFEQIGNVRYEMGTDAHRDAVARRDTARARRKKARNDARDGLIKLQARCDQQTRTIAELQSQLKLANDPARIEHAARVKAAVVARAQRVLGREAKLDGLSNYEIKLRAVEAVDPDVRKRLDSYKTERDRAVYVDGAFRSLKGAPRAREAGRYDDEARRIDGGGVPEHLRQAPPDFQLPNPTGETFEARKRRRDEAESMRHTRPLTVSKDNPSKPIEQNGFGVNHRQGSMLETME